MDELILMEPTEGYTEDIWKLRQEILDADDNDKFAGCGCLRTCSSAQEWIDAVRIGSNANNIPEGKVPSNIYIAVRKRDNRIVGVIDLRHHINHPILGTWGGHIGYYVRPTERKKGYASEMLRLNLLNAKQLGIDKVLVTCDADNIGSKKTILANGGVFEKEILVDDCLMKRYWITV